MKRKICPICGKGVLERVTKIEKIEDHFAGVSEVEEVEYLCPVCGERGDFFDENSKNLEKAYKEQKRVATANILDSFTKNGMNFAAIERSLEIPQRTLAKWKGQYTEPSAAAVALLKYLYTFPWLLEVADTNFDSAHAETVLCKAYVNSLGRAMSSSPKNDMNMTHPLDNAQVTFTSNEKDRDVHSFRPDTAMPYPQDDDLEESKEAQLLEA